MIRINDLLKKYKIVPKRYEKDGNVVLIDSSEGKFAVKNANLDNNIFSYLKSRNFNYYPDIIGSDDDYHITNYIEGIDYPSEQKMSDMINLLALLHNKTTHYKEIDFDYYKEIYEDINNNIEYLYSYYMDHITLIEAKQFMSPSEFLLARNFSKILISLNYCKYEIKQWYDLVKEKTKQRIVVLHNNLDLSHYLKNEQQYFTSWEKSKFGIPIFDLYILYRRHSLEFSFGDLLVLYEKVYPLSLDERKLFFILIALPEKLEFNKKEYQQTLEISKMIDTLYRTEQLISPYNTKQDEQNK